MGEKRQRTWADCEGKYPSGMAMDQYLRDRDRDRREGLQAAADRVAELLREIIGSISTLGKRLPTFGECEDALRAYNEAVEAIRNGNRREPRR